MSLPDKVVVVTGASSGLGAALAAAFAGEGAAVVGFARRFAPGKLPPLVAGQVAEVQLDVTDEAAVRARFAELPGVDVLINNAGNYQTAPFLEETAADFRATLDVHVIGAFLCAREALRLMSTRRRGHIVNVSSIAAHRTFPGAVAYTAAKEALRGLTRVLVEEARAHDVRVTGLYPGAVDTPAWDRSGFDRARMMPAASIAKLVVDLVRRPELSVEELVVLPPGGVL